MSKFPESDSTVPGPVPVPDTAATDKPDAPDKWKRMYLNQSINASRINK